MTSLAESAPAGETVALRCMEIWGGNRAVDQAASVPGIDVYVQSTPHDGGASGGDIYYISQCGAGNIARIVLADVAGHGADVSELALSLQKMMRKHINTADQTQFARDLNREFDAIETGGRFATALLATYWAPTNHLILVNAGHPPPLHYRKAEGRWSSVERGAGEAGEVANLPLGVIAPLEYSQDAIGLDEGDIVLMYTDALVEASGSDGVQLGVEGLLELVSGVDASEPGRIAAQVRDRVRQVRGGMDSDDDETIIVLEHNGGAPPRQSLGEKLSMIGRMAGLGRVYRGGLDGANGA